MTTQVKIIIVLLTLIVIVVVVQMVLDYQKTERQYQACLDKCQTSYSGSTVLGKYGYIKTCEAECREKYGK